MLMLPTDFYFVLTFDVESKKDNMDYNLLNHKIENLNFEMVRPYYE